MKAVGDDTELTYSECSWGDYISGTKEQLQALGLGVGIAFPGEFAGPRWRLKVRDRRGFDVLIAKGYRTGRFHAYVHFPDWPVEPHVAAQADWSSAFPGVERRPSYWFDEYRGSAAALAGAGLVPATHFPGLSGMRKSRVSIYADGSLPQGPRNVNKPRSREPGARWVERVSCNTFRVCVVVAKDEAERRRNAARLAEAAYESEVSMRRRPARLAPLPAAQRAEFDRACAAAARDVRFQGFLARVVSG